MPFSVSRPSKDLKKKIKERHPKATKNEIQQFIHVFNNTLKDTGSESRAFAYAWGVLNSNKKLKSSHRKTDPAETKKKVRKQEQKEKRKKKSSVEYRLTKLAESLMKIGLDSYAFQMGDIGTGIDLPPIDEDLRKGDDNWHVVYYWRGAPHGLTGLKQNLPRKYWEVMNGHGPYSLQEGMERLREDVRNYIGGVSDYEEAYMPRIERPSNKETIFWLRGKEASIMEPDPEPGGVAVLKLMKIPIDGLYPDYFDYIKTPERLESYMDRISGT
jgi:hypothetical protein